jgi:AhpD family alkylhydroperoxidase
LEINYPEHRAHLQKLIGDLAKASPDTMSSFTRLRRDSVADGALSIKTKELMAVAISIAVRCDGCIAYHVHDALRAGATRQEVIETIDVAVMMGGGPSVVYGAQALDAAEQFTSVPA